MRKKGFTLLELLIVLAIIGIIVGVVLSTFVGFNKNQALSRDEETVVETLEQARSQTLSSINETQYGIHFASSTVTLFTGSTYSSSAPSNLVYLLNSYDTVLSLALTGGGYDVIFNRLTGETADTGTVKLTSASTGTTKTVTIYTTGLVDSN